MARFYNQITILDDRISLKYTVLCFCTSAEPPLVHTARPLLENTLTYFANKYRGQDVAAGGQAVAANHNNPVAIPKDSGVDVPVADQAFVLPPGLASQMNPSVDMVALKDNILRILAQVPPYNFYQRFLDLVAANDQQFEMATLARVGAQAIISTEQDNQARQDEIESEQGDGSLQAALPEEDGAAADADRDDDKKPVAQDMDASH